MKKTLRPADGTSKDTDDALERTQATVRAAAGSTAAMYPIETLMLAGNAAATHTDAEAGRVISATLEVLAAAIGAAIDGDPEAIVRLERMRRAGADTASSYLYVQKTCEAYLAGADLVSKTKSPEEFGREQRLVHELATHVDPAFLLLHGRHDPPIDDTDIRALAKVSKDAGDLGARLIIRVDAISPRRKGESSEAHAKRIRGAMSDARSEQNVKRANVNRTRR